jgi:hypothetical protein
MGGESQMTQLLTELFEVCKINHCEQIATEIVF